MGAQEWCTSPERPWQLFNSLLDKEDLPPEIVAQIVANTESDSALPDLHLSALPTFDRWRQVYRSVWDLQGVLSPSDWSQMLEIWLPVLGVRPTLNSEKQTSE